MWSPSYHRPERMNAINGQMREELNAAWLRFRDDTDAWVAILTGAGRAFCAGADIRKVAPLAPLPAPSGRSPQSTPSKVDLNSSSRPSRRLTGRASAMVSAIAFCDFVIASQRATFGFPEVRLGVPTIVGAIRMPQRLAWADAMELLLIGEPVDAERARAMGLVWKVVPHDDLMAEARHLAERLCQAAPLAVRATKEVAVRSRTLPWVEAVRFGETMRLVAGIPPMRQKAGPPPATSAPHAGRGSSGGPYGGANRAWPPAYRGHRVRPDNTRRCQSQSPRPG